MAIGGGVPSTKGLPVVKGFGSFAPTQQQDPSVPFVQSDDSSSYSVINARRVAAAAMLLAASSGLFLPPTPVSAMPEGWQQPLSSAAPVARAAVATDERPIAPIDITGTLNATDITDTASFLGPIAAAAEIGIPLYSGSAPPRYRKVYFQTRSEPPYLAPVVTQVVPVGWQQQLSTAPAVTRTPTVDYALPLYTAPVQAPTWLGALSSAPAPRRAVDTNQSFPFFTPPSLSLAWQQPLAGRPASTTAQAGFGFVPFDKPQVSVNYTDFSWFAPLSVAPKTATAQVGFGFFPFNTAQVAVSFTSFGWHQALSTPSAVAKAQVGFGFVPYDTIQTSFSFATFGWYQALSTAPPVAKAQAGFGFVPYNTAQVSAAFTAFGWQGSLETAPRVLKAPADFGSFSPLTVTLAQGWQASLEIAPRPVRVRAEFGSVPYNTAQVAVNFTAFGWQGALETRTVRRATTADYALPPYTAVVPTTVTMAWQQQLSGIPRKPKAPEGFVLVPFTRLAVTGTLNATEAPDTALFNGSVIVSGTLVTTEAPDTALFSGSILGVISGTFTAIDNVDIANFHGHGPVSPPAKATSKHDYTWYMQEKMRKPTSYYD